ncbi:hypothetical protein CVT26_011802 [Gymnopilus dilepis]|uniref:Helicase C-terminal domain-containing protein n=1 Tax=Gymnopilus dilepis TaxID=231916 RepID=A0A409X288_9AGAR|nr:hypothetical protein CVT26_011802 [Gymnopilus dilepis]
MGGIYPEGSRHLENIRLWTSITPATYNNKTLDPFKDNEDTSFIVATIPSGMGMNLQSILDSINLGLPTTYAGLVQQNGRAGRNESVDSRGCTYCGKLNAFGGC